MGGTIRVQFIGGNIDYVPAKDIYDSAIEAVERSIVIFEDHIEEQEAVIKRFTLARDSQKYHLEELKQMEKDNEH